ncbi:hypothetical protein Q31a_20220 [Aureliella helgolandensis]|uniref:Uncharacterized protein n=1 Tax=Aureliella helgolandensis TaxID=2527968 RepID=A0A518G544_9BACT|nr:hypothetical protein Q31a_20220 [Aureliella helgolandensis]
MLRRARSSLKTFVFVAAGIYPAFSMGENPAFESAISSSSTTVKSLPAPPESNFTPLVPHGLAPTPATAPIISDLPLSDLSRAANRLKQVDYTQAADPQHESKPIEGVVHWQPQPTFAVAESPPATSLTTSSGPTHSAGMSSQPPATAPPLPRPEAPAEATSAPTSAPAPTSTESQHLPSINVPANAVPTETPHLVSQNSALLPIPAYEAEQSNTSCQACGNSGCLACGRSTAETQFGRFIEGVYAGVCCPDPCYQPRWTMLANASLFTDPVRPQSRQQFRWSYYDDFRHPDRSEYLWARSGVRGPAPEASVDYHELSMYIETGSEKFSFFVNTPYRSLYLDSGGHYAGFADLTTGTKTLLFDTALTQVALQFATHIPSANPRKGLGNAHVSLEPSLLFGVQLSSISYLQLQFSEWIPIAGDRDYSGAMLQYSTSYNRTLLGSVNGTSLTGTLEYTGTFFQDGAYTDSTSGHAISASNQHAAQLGGGLRLNICNKLNIGFGSLFDISGQSWPGSSVRTEIQFRH